MDRHLLQTPDKHASLQHKHVREKNGAQNRYLPHLPDSNLVSGVVKQLQSLADVLGGAEEIKQLFVVDLQQGHFDGKLHAIFSKFLKDLVEGPRDDTGQWVLKDKEDEKSIQNILTELDISVLTKTD